jgi:hypothetical protein
MSQESATETQAKIEKVCKALATFLVAKNKNYGNSALEPIRVFSKVEADVGMMVRMDDKLSRLRNSEKPRRNDVVDLLGYLGLYCVKQNWDDFSDLID